MHPYMKPRVAVVKNTLLAFPTPIHQVRFDGHSEFNAEVARRVLAMRDQACSEKYSNVGGWQVHNDDFLKNLEEPYGSQLSQMFIQGVRGAVESLVELSEHPPVEPFIECWQNVNNRGDSNTVHVHPGSTWSGVYYVATDLDAHGEIFFIDPRVAALMSSHPYNPFKCMNPVLVAPQPGMLVVFPSFLYHGVTTYEGHSPRIAIAFNLW
jgi:uncharacterized protein (TIGR02466 family)